MAPAAERITDKLPANFRYAGLIHLTLPNARIIHVRRDPRDIAVSCFSLLFVKIHCPLAMICLNSAGTFAAIRHSWSIGARFCQAG